MAKDDLKKPKRKSSIKTRNRKSKRRRVISLYLTALSAVIMLIISVTLLTYFDNLTRSRKEYNALQLMGEESAFDAGMREINPDYLCWLTIDGTNVDYPVVRGGDNEKYLVKSFSGEQNPFGAIFMDYRCVGEYVPHIIIYGHNSRHGDMFGGLEKFLDRQYMAERPIITLKINDRIVEYEIFAARNTTVTDPAYELDFRTPGSFRAFAGRCGAPPNSKQIITLSTCVNDDDDKRVIVQGAVIY